MEISIVKASNHITIVYLHYPENYLHNPVIDNRLYPYPLFQFGPIKNTDPSQYFVP